MRTAHKQFFSHFLSAEGQTCTHILETVRVISPLYAAFSRPGQGRLASTDRVCTAKVDPSISVKAPYSLRRRVLVLYISNRQGLEYPRAGSEVFASVLVYFVSQRTLHKGIRIHGDKVYGDRIE